MLKNKKNSSSFFVILQNSREKIKKYRHNIFRCADTLYQVLIIFILLLNNLALCNLLMT